MICALPHPHRMACLGSHSGAWTLMIAGSVGVNGEKRSQSLKPGEKQRSIDLQQPMLKMARSTPPIAPARSLTDLNGAQALKHQHHTPASQDSVLAELYSRLACFAESVSAGLGASAVLQLRAQGIASTVCQEHLHGARSAKAFNVNGLVERLFRGPKAACGSFWPSAHTAVGTLQTGGGYEGPLCSR